MFLLNWHFKINSIFFTHRIYVILYPSYYWKAEPIPSCNGTNGMWKLTSNCGKCCQNYFNRPSCRKRNRGIHQTYKRYVILRLTNVRNWGNQLPNDYYQIKIFNHLRLLLQCEAFKKWNFPWNFIHLLKCFII